MDNRQNYGSAVHADTALSWLRAASALKKYHEKVRRLYEGSCHWPKNKQVRRVSDYRRRWLAWIGCVCLSLAMIPQSRAAVLEVLPGQGLVGLKSSLSLNGTNNRTCGSTYEYFYSRTMSNGQTLTRRTSSDGKAFGFLVPGSEDMYIVFSGAGSVSGTGISSITINWYTNKAPTWVGGNNVTYQDNAGSYYMAIGSSLYKNYTTNSTSGSVSSYIYVGPNTRKGLYTLPEIGFDLGCAVMDTIKLSDTSYTVQVGKHACSVSAPPSVDFGAIAANGEPNGTRLAEFTTAINVDCDIPSLLPAKLTFSGDEDSRNGLALYNADRTQLAPARVMGIMTSVAGALSNGCSQSKTTPGAIRFDNEPSVSSVQIPGNIPLRFDLCRWGGDSRVDRVGLFTGSATVTVNWD